LWEWVEDDWHANYDLNGDGFQIGGDSGNDGPSDGRAWVDSPRGGAHVVRGGDYYDTAPFLRAAYRDHESEGTGPTYSDAAGARCCRTP